MVKSSFLDGQGLGNQLWLYAAVRGIAKEKNIPFSFDGYESFKGKDFLDIDLGQIDNKNETFTILREKMYYDSDLKYFASDYDFSVNTLHGNTHLEGLFQSENYFYGRKDLISEWIVLSKEMLTYSKQFSDTCILNIRGGEYKRFKELILPKKYWEDAIHNVQSLTKVDKFLIVTDDKSYAKAMFPQFEVLDANVGECYAALYGAKSIIVSNSSFSYFPIKSRKDKPIVIAPYQWSRFNNNFDRWCAPCNYYSDWLWQSPDGVLVSPEKCLENVKKTQNYYTKNFTLCIKSDSVFENKKLINIFLGKRARVLIKKMLSIIFPKSIG